MSLQKLVITAAKVKGELQPYIKNIKTILANSAHYELSYKDFEVILKLIAKDLYTKKTKGPTEFSLLLNSISPFSIASYSIPLNGNHTILDQSLVSSTY